MSIMPVMVLRLAPSGADGSYIATHSGRITARSTRSTPPLMDSMGNAMLVVLQTLGSRGDAQPFLALGRRRRRAGHDVRVATSEEFAGSSRLV